MIPSIICFVTTIIIYCILIFPSRVLGEYDVSEEQLARIPYRYASASFARDGILYSYGGVTRNASASTLFTSIAFDEVDGQVIYSDVTQLHGSPGAAYSEAVLLPDNNRVLLFGGRNMTDAGNDVSSINNSTAGSGILRLYEYRFDTQNWTALPIQTSDKGSELPRNRKDFTATLSATNGKIYIHGGQDFQPETNGIVPTNDSWVFDSTTYVFTRLTSALPDQSPSDLYGHSSVALDNGHIIHIMGNGHYGSNYYDSNNNGTFCDRALVLDTNTETWSIQPLTGNPPQQITYGFAVLGPDHQTVYMSGGIGASRTLENIVVSSNDLNALNTSTWTWESLDSETAGDPPKPRFYTSAQLLYNTYMVVAFGVSEYFWYNDINVLRFRTTQNGTVVADWTPNLDMPPQLTQIGFFTNASLSAEAKMAIAVGALAAAIVTVAYISWYYRDSAKEMLGRSYRCLIWTSRTGEPMWTGLAHILSKMLLSCIFLAYLIYTIFQVANSSVATLTSATPTESVSVPDIRFCFDGWYKPSIGCQTETLSIDDCVSLEYLSPLDMGIHQPYFGYTGNVDCFLFHPDDHFKLSGAPSAPYFNGSRIQFSFYGNAINENSPGLVHITLYPRGMDPNLSYYFNKTQVGYDDGTIDRDNWLHDESNNLVSENTYTVKANTSSAVSYQLSTHRYLEASAWNNFGIWYAYNDTPGIQTWSLIQGSRSASPRPVNMTGNNFLDVYPASYSYINLLDQRIYTILSSVGPCGGLLALLITLNSWMFGARPKSPWGVIHRFLWTDRSRDSLLNGLRQKFGGVTTAGNIPFINPVDKKLYPKTDLEADWHELVLNPYQYQEQQQILQQKRHRQIRGIRQEQRQQQQPSESTAVNESDENNQLSVVSSRRLKAKSSFNTTIATTGGYPNDDPQKIEKDQTIPQQQQHQEDDLSSSPTLTEAVKKIEQLQKRVQLTELLLKAYYIDEEVFRSLHIALAQKHTSDNSSNNNNTGDDNTSSIVSSSPTNHPEKRPFKNKSRGDGDSDSIVNDSSNNGDKSLTPPPSHYHVLIDEEPRTPPETPTTPPPAFHTHSSCSADSFASSSRDPPPPRFSSLSSIDDSNITRVPSSRKLSTYSPTYHL
ncbi:hypothetical protein BDA99DRAFT_585167 [Phascolomyces articulosus]|uniref:Attractin/MKLN-like beta-propeller domain-containing protein n=1 Tax=Phascolomyces articulosus TaxID=60185 RepID=A0AAD5K643_9FUNG|nr:hypothetical protein BDA99DRAFT_585167 [Phascolomyces articulosus]